jgi:hypothetical protein
MPNRVLSALSRFFEGTGVAVSTPAGDARGHVRAYPFPAREANDLYRSDRFIG